MGTVQRVRAGFLTVGEIELLQHRLAVPECIADALADEFDRDEVCDAATTVLAILDAGASVADLLSLRLEMGAAWDVLVEAMEGSTWVNADLLGGSRLDRMAYRAACRAAGRLEERFGAIIEEHAGRLTRFAIPRR